VKEYSVLFIGSRGLESVGLAHESSPRFEKLVKINRYTPSDQKKDESEQERDSSDDDDKPLNVGLHSFILRV